MILKAFHNDVTVQQKYISRVEEHYKLDEIIKGQYWENGKGCAVGCTVHSDSHNCYEIELGIPTWVARLEDTLFEGMPNEKAKEFPLKLLKSIPLGFENWQHIYHQLCVFNLTKICKNTDNEIVVKAISDIIALHKTESTDESAWSAARSAWSERSAARSVWSVAWLAAESAALLTAMSAGSVTRSVAWLAESAATSAELAATSAVRSAATSAARSAAYYEISEKLIRLLENEKH